MSPLEAALAERALVAADDMATLLVEIGPGHDGSLARGAAGHAVALAYLGRDLARPELTDEASASLGRAVETMAAKRLSVGLMQGFTGVAWAVAHLEAAGLVAPPGDLDAVDDALAAAARRDKWPGNYDLVSGLVGVGVYALERGDQGRDLLALVVRSLDALAERADGGLTWFTPPELLPAEARARVPGGYYNLGMAHGVPGAIALLARAARAGIDEAAPLLSGAIRWLLERRLPAGSRSEWPYFTGPGIDPAPARLAWCYGAPGIAVALDSAARVEGAQVAEVASSTWDEVVARAADPAAAGVQGASLCHGAAGLAHLLAAGHGVTGRPDLAAAAAVWVERALDARVRGVGLGGYSVWDPDLDDESGDLQGPGLLAGLAGVALALSGAATGAPTAWDRMLLVSDPP